MEFHKFIKYFTIQFFSPMTRTLFDSFLDIFYFIYLSLKEELDIKKINTPYFWINIISQIIVSYKQVLFKPLFLLYNNIFTKLMNNIQILFLNSIKFQIHKNH